MNEFIRELKTFLKDNVSKFTDTVHGVGGCDTCGYGAPEYHDLDMDDLEKQIDLFAHQFKEKQMSITKVEDLQPGDYVCVYLPHGWVQFKREGEGIVIDVFDHKDELFTTQAIFDEDLAPEEQPK